jgi:hypothetical protein
LGGIALKNIIRVLVILNLSIGMRIENKKSELEGRHFSAVSREMAGNLKA